MEKHLRHCLLTFLCGLLCLSATARELKMVTIEWPPFGSEHLPNGGPLTEIVTEAFRRTGHKTSVEFLPWTRAKRDVITGKADIILGAYYSDERASKHTYSKPIMMVDVGIVAHKNLGITSFKKLQELSPYTIGIAKGWVYTPEFDAAAYLKKDEAKNQMLNVRKFSFRRVDMIAISLEAFRYENAKLRHSAEHPAHVFLEPLLSRSPLHVLMGKNQKDNIEVIAQFDKALEEMHADGTYTQIIMKHKMQASAGCSPDQLRK